jgi:hypothetical protein
VHTNVILASLRVEVGSERVGAFAFPSAGSARSGSVPPSAISFGDFSAKSPFFRDFFRPESWQAISL